MTAQNNTIQTRAAGYRSIIALICLLTTAVGQASFSGLEVGYQIKNLALAGGGSLLVGTGNDRMNPATTDTISRQVNFGWLNYPAGIESGRIALKFRKNRFHCNVSLRHLSYGTFDGYTADAKPTGTYFSGDTWFSISIARKNPEKLLDYGITTGLFASQLEKYKATILTLTPGILLNLRQIGIKVGLSLQNGGIILDGYSTASEELPTKLVVGISRNLAYLPLELNLDLGYHVNDELPFFGLGGIFTLPLGFSLFWGTSSAKIEQGPGNQDARDLFAASGFALSYSIKNYHFDIGSYFYGPGAWGSGLGLGVSI